MGNDRENSSERDNSLEKQIIGLHRRAINYLNEHGMYLCTNNADIAEELRGDFVLNKVPFQALDENGNITEREYTVQTGLFACLCGGSNEDRMIPDDAVIYFGFEEEPFLQVAPSKASIVDGDDKKLRDAEKNDLKYHAGFTSCIITPPRISMLRYYPVDKLTY
ncbi:MAG: hypothetical protein AAB675_03440 [Patescibacteria group bacterium]